MELSTLKAKITATSSLSKTLNTTAAAADRVADSMSEGAVAGTELAAGLSLSEGEAKSLARNLGEANSELAEGAAQGAVYAEGLDETAQKQAESSAAAALFAQRLERVGDEATQSAAQLGAFSAAADSATESSLRANLAGVSGSLTRVGTVAAAATPPVLALSSGLAGIAGFSGVGALAAGGLTTAGIQARAEEMAAMSSELENAAAARELLFANLKSQLADAFAPIQNADVTQQFALRNLEAVVDIAEDASTSLQAVDDTVIGVAAGLREAAVATSPEAFAALAEQTERLAPLFSRLDGAIRSIPSLINYLADVTSRIGTDLFVFASALVEAGAGATELGVAVLDTLLPALSGTLFLAGNVLSIFQMIPGPLQNAAVAFGVLAAAGVVLTSSNYALSASMFTLTGATTALTGALTALTAPLSVPIILAATLGAALVGLAYRFNLVGDAANLATGAWNTLVEIAEASVNAVLGAANAVGDFLGPLSLLVPGFGPAIYVISHWSEIMNTAGDVVGWLGARIRWLARQAQRYLGPVLDLVGETSDRIDEAGGVELDAAKFGDDGDGGGSSSGPSGGPPGPPPAAPAATTGSGSTDQSVNIDTLVVEDRSGNADQTADKVIKRLEKRSRREGGHPTG